MTAMDENEKEEEEKKAMEEALADIMQDINLEEQKSEAAFIKKLNLLREEITTEETFTTTDILPTEEPDILSQSIAIKFTDIITFLEKEKVETPFADEFWEFYYNNKQIKDPRKYMGGNAVREKIIGLLSELNEFVLNPEVLDLNHAFNEKMQSGKLYYVGDTHGSIIDTDKCIRFFVKQIEKAELNNEDLRIIFLGDYVDRNKMDIHNLLYILTFTMKYSKYVRILRGNHEEVTINMRYGFWHSINKYLPNLYLFNDFEYFFMRLPLVHAVHYQSESMENPRVLVSLHGGIPIYDKKFTEMPEIPKIIQGLDFLDPAHSNIDEMDDLSQQILWNDPADDLPPNMLFLPSRRGIGFNFGKEVFDEWMRENQADRLIRGHEVFLEGFKNFFNDRLFSVFSSSKYVYRRLDAKILEFDFSKPWESNWRYLTISKEL
ncbi:metallophosphoesterase family protein [Promethearchaeum syntrophicum]|uniref:Metallophosphoesterase family protein n=1 Tax=Promethearchaeum syntrophicum TaxID=2594042 RepID=A0A5B9DFE9_9ARCH|nr:metallophosphoesterase family protein [Candidatus Prometheoarchaeum syntrophicum]QEE17513.1 Calcineurin-like phosphoesterase [Candidatus Prometheoarchaeum syntrophicum]